MSLSAGGPAPRGSPKKTIGLISLTGELNQHFLQSRELTKHLAFLFSTAESGVGQPLQWQEKAGHASVRGVASWSRLCGRKILHTALPPPRGYSSRSGSECPAGEPEGFHFPKDLSCSPAGI